MIKVNGVEIPLGTPGVGVPAGGGQGQLLAKKTDNDFDTEWTDIPTATEDTLGLVKSSSGTDKVVVDDDGTMSVTDVSLAEHATEADKVLHPLTIGDTPYVYDYDGSNTKTLKLQDLAKHLRNEPIDFNSLYTANIVSFANGTTYTGMPNQDVSYYPNIQHGAAVIANAKAVENSFQLLSNYNDDRLFFRTGNPQYASGKWQPWCEVITDLNSAINPNIAINYDFRNPVNQRGQTSYNVNGYCIDDWFFRKDSGVDGTLTLTDDGVRIQSIGNGTSSRGLNQRIEFPEKYIGKTVTLSIFIAQNNNSDYFRIGLPRASSVNYDSDWSYGPVVDIPAGTTGLVTVTGIIKPFTGTNYVAQNIGVYLGSSNSTIDMTISAIKLELGPRQTLARRNSSGQWEICDVADYGEQLAKCQRYFQNLNLYKDAYAYYGCGAYTSSTRAYIIVPLSVSLRSKPSINWNGNITLFNTNYYGVKNILIDRIGANNVSLAIDSENLVANSYYNCFSRNDVNSYIYLNAQL